MVTRKKNIVSEQNLPTELLISQDDAKSKLQNRIQKGLDLKQVQINSLKTLDNAKKEYYKWNDFTAAR